MLALDVEGAKKIGIVLVFGLTAFAVVSLFVVKQIFTKLLWVVLLSGLALGVWTQRQNLQNCADKVKAATSTTGVTPTKCTFFGGQVDLPKVKVPTPTTPTTPSATTAPNGASAPTTTTG